MAWKLPTQRSPAERSQCCLCGAPCPLPAAFVRIGYNGYYLVTANEATQEPGESWWGSVDLVCWQRHGRELTPYVTLQIERGTPHAHYIH